MTTSVMVHGAFCGGWAFDSFRRPFEAAGWTVHAPDLRGHGTDADRSAVGGLSMSDYAADLVRFCEDLPERPVLIGHSMGGLVCQLAAQRVRPQALVLLAPSAPWGVSGSSVEEAITALGVQFLDPFWSGVVAPDLHLMRRHSLDRVPRAERHAILAKVGCESARALREVLNWWLDPFMTTSLGVGGVGAPALAVAGGRDVVHPASTVQLTAARIGAEYRLLPQMSHWLIGETGWEDVAGLVLDWQAGAERVAA
jgi:pimeloyl-ACP methyl ester carboxylesterase